MATNLTITNATYNTATPKFGSGALTTPSTTTSAPLSSAATSWTAECWAKITSTVSTTQLILSLGTDFYIELMPSGAASFAAPGQGSNNGNAVTLNVWHHFAFVQNGSTGTLYLDGASVATLSAGAYPFPNLAVGIRDFAGAPYAGFALSGDVDEVAFWNFAKYTGAFTPPTSAYAGTEPGLIAYYPLNGNGNDLATGSSVTIAPNNAAFAYSPWNWYLTATEAVSWNFLGYFSILFTASNTCLLLFDTSQQGAARPAEILWRIDDQQSWTRVAIASTVTLTIPVMPTTNSNSYHHLEVRVCCNDNSGNRFAATAPPRLRFNGIRLDPGASVLAPVQHTTKILWFGDSIAEGAEARCAGGAASNAHSDGSMGLAQAMTNLLGAEVGAVGWGSTGYLTGAADVPAFSGQWNFLASGVARPMTPEPDLVVINQGTNDGTSDITVACRTVVNAMLAQWPRTRIILLNPIPQPGDPQPKPHPNTYLQAAARTCNDPARVTYLDTLGLYDYSKGSASPGYHPSESNVSGLLGRNIANLLRPYLAARVNKRWQYA